MAALFLPLFFFFFWSMNDLHDSVIKIQNQIKTLSALDKKLGDKAEELSHSLNAALSINYELGVLYAMCPAATVSGSLPALQTKGEMARVMQEIFLQSARAQMMIVSSLEFDKEFNPPQRRPSGVCNLPGMLYCPQKIIFSIKSRDGTKPAGVKSEGDICFRIQWTYSDSRVRPLE